MSTSMPKRSTLLRYWTLRYVVTLSVGLLMIGVGSVLWLRHEALTNRLQSIENLLLDATSYVTGDTGQIVVPDDFYQWIDSNQRKYKLPGQFGLTVFDQTGHELFYKSAPSLADGSNPSLTSAPVLEDRVVVKKVGSQYKIVTPIHGRNNAIIGVIAVSYAKKELTDISQQFGLISSLLLLSGLLGWLILYLLLRKLSKPIEAVVHALKQIQTGKYALVQQDSVKEQEIYDLLVYFNATATRLEQLEHLRTELLAGVTHDLRTPITSIRGLLRAVKDEVVIADEAKEFLDISLKETQRLEQMVSDLLDFNAFASGQVRMQTESIDLGKLLGEIVYQWSLIYQEDDLDIRMDIPEGKLIAFGDTGRIQQILVNLLNNSRQACEGHCILKVSLMEHSSTQLEIQVTDNGSGIPLDEQSNIYERYFRGTNKKLAVRGLGLGLTFSRMLAAAMNGMLILKDSSAVGTTFQLLLPKASDQRDDL